MQARERTDAGWGGVSRMSCRLAAFAKKLAKCER